MSDTVLVNRIMYRELLAEIMRSVDIINRLENQLALKVKEKEKLGRELDDSFTILEQYASKKKLDISWDSLPNFIRELMEAYDKPK